MRLFAALYDAIDSTTSTNAKVSAMATYFRETPPADAAWAVFFLTGRRLKRLVSYPAIHPRSTALTAASLVGIPASSATVIGFTGGRSR